MEYLAELRFVHRDLAARNVMVASDHTCAVGDFGMSRQLQEDGAEYYRMQSIGLIPCRWTAVEALMQRKYSTASDVRSIDVMVWCTPVGGYITHAHEHPRTSTSTHARARTNPLDVQCSDVRQIKCRAVRSLMARARVCVCVCVCVCAFLRVFLCDCYQVWSFGVLLYEIFTDCGMPYAELNNEQVIAGVQAGHRLQRPPLCPPYIFEDIMFRCWLPDPTMRPAFKEITTRLRFLLEGAARPSMVPGVRDDSMLQKSATVLHRSSNGEAGVPSGDQHQRKVNTAPVGVGMGSHYWSTGAAYVTQTGSLPSEAADIHQPKHQPGYTAMLPAIPTVTAMMPTTPLWPEFPHSSQTQGTGGPNDGVVAHAWPSFSLPFASIALPATDPVQSLGLGLIQPPLTDTGGNQGAGYQGAGWARVSFQPGESAPVWPVLDIDVTKAVSRRLSELRLGDMDGANAGTVELTGTTLPQNQAVVTGGAGAVSDYTRRNSGSIGSATVVTSSSAQALAGGVINPASEPQLSGGSSSNTDSNINSDGLPTRCSAGFYSAVGERKLSADDIPAWPSLHVSTRMNVGVPAPAVERRSDASSGGSSASSRRSSNVFGICETSGAGRPEMTTDAQGVTRMNTIKRQNPLFTVSIAEEGSQAGSTQGTATGSSNASAPLSHLSSSQPHDQYIETQAGVPAALGAADASTYIQAEPQALPPSNALSAYVPL